MPHSRTVTLFLLFALLCLDVRAGAQEPGGDRIYAAKCVRCHGAAGEGSKHNKRRLEGDRSVAQLAEVIRKTMPESDPGTLTDKEARAVAEYIHGAFYSALARERNRPARIELARLTVKQYRHAVADLIGSFRSSPSWSDRRGLNAAYFKGRRLFGNRDRVLERVDPQVAFDFGTKSPVGDKASPYEFSIRWQGSLLVPQTGEYEFVVRTEHAAQLWVNDNRRPLIDALVKSGNDTEYRATLFLVGGRAYPLRLDYTKAKQGVDDSKTNKNKKPPTKSSITLLWKAPGESTQPIPSRYFSPNSAPEVFVCTAPFPPDDRSLGWERGSTVSKEWDQAATDAAIETAGYVVARLGELSGDRDDSSNRKKLLKKFCHTLAQRAFRKPLSDEERAVIDRQFAAGKDLETGVKRVVLLVLKSPRFLYREVGGSAEGYGIPPALSALAATVVVNRSGGALTSLVAARCFAAVSATSKSGREPDYDVASRLALGLWDSLPDKELLDAAATARLSSREQVVKQAERMLRDIRGRAKLRDFLLTWLRADHGHDLMKDPRAFPGFDLSVVTDLRASLEMFLDDILWSESSDYRRLLLSEEIFLNDRLAKFYGVSVKAELGFQKVKLDPGRRAGVLSHPYLMSSLAYGAESSPIHRGVFLVRGVLGVALRPPPQAVTPVPPSLHPGLTTRERVTMQTRENSCMTCHGIINPLGFALENFDAIGRYREKENGKPIDAVGYYQGRDGKRVNLTGARELATFLAGSPEAQAAFVEQMFHYLIQQPVRAYGATALDDLRRSFAANGYNMRKLAVEIVTMAALKPRRVENTQVRR